MPIGYGDLDEQTDDYYYYYYYCILIIDIQPSAAWETSQPI